MLKNLNKVISTPIAIGIILLVAVIVGGIFLWQYWGILSEGGKMIPKTGQPKIQRENLEALVTECEGINLDNIQKRALCFINLGKKQVNAKACDMIEDASEKAYCYGGVAGAKRDLRVCDELKQQISKNGGLTEREIDNLLYYYPIYGSQSSVLNYCYAGAAISQRNSDVCSWYFEVGSQLDGLERKPSQCYWLVATIEGDFNICDKMDEVEHMLGKGRDFCYGLVGGILEDISVCDNFQGDRDYCYLGFAESSNYVNVNLCDKIQSNYLSTKDRCYISIARKLRDIDVCKKISVDVLREDCYKELAKELKAPNLCKNIQQGKCCFYCAAPRDDCYIEVAKELREPDICEEAVCNKGWCYRELAIILEDFELCRHFGDPFNPYDSCWKAVARKAGNVALCEAITDKEDKEGCYWGLAAKLKNVEFCEKIRDRYIQESCFRDVARVSTSSEDIRMIFKKLIQTNEEIRDDIYESFAILLKDLSICERTKWVKHRCHQRLVEKNKKMSMEDIDICEKVNETSWRNGKTCYMNIARYEGNSDICKKLLHKDDQDECYEEVKIAVQFADRLKAKGWILL